MRTLMVNGEKVHCPVCDLVRNQKSYLELRGPSHWPTEDKALRCNNCGRQFESVRWFFDYFCTRTVPKIEAEMKERAIIVNPEDEERKAEWRWKRERKAKQAIEEGTWNPMIGEHLK